MDYLSEKIQKKKPSFAPFHKYRTHPPKMNGMDELDQVLSFQFYYPKRPQGLHELIASHLLKMMSPRQRNN